MSDFAAIAAPHWAPRIPGYPSRVYCVRRFASHSELTIRWWYANGRCVQRHIGCIEEWTAIPLFRGVTLYFHRPTNCIVASKSDPVVPTRADWFPPADADRGAPTRGSRHYRRKQEDVLDQHAPGLPLLPGTQMRYEVDGDDVTLYQARNLMDHRIGAPAARDAVRVHKVKLNSPDMLQLTGGQRYTATGPVLIAAPLTGAPIPGTQYFARLHTAEVAVIEFIDLGVLQRNATKRVNGVFHFRNITFSFDAAQNVVLQSQPSTTGELKWL